MQIYKILKNISWCGMILLKNMLFDFPEVAKSEQLDILVKQGLIEKTTKSKNDMLITNRLIKKTNKLNDNKPEHNFLLFDRNIEK